MCIWPGIFLLTGVLISLTDEIVLGKHCKQDAECPTGAVCTQRSCDHHVCQCDIGFTVTKDREACKSVSLIGGKCTGKFDCLLSNTDCINGICVCPNGSEASYDNFKCMNPRRNGTRYGDNCSDGDRCGYRGECRNATCRCEDGYTPMTEHEKWLFFPQSILYVNCRKPKLSIDYCNGTNIINVTEPPTTTELQIPTSARSKENSSVISTVQSYPPSTISSRSEHLTTPLSGQHINLSEYISLTPDNQLATTSTVIATPRIQPSLSDPTMTALHEISDSFSYLATSPWEQFILSGSLNVLSSQSDDFEYLTTNYVITPTTPATSTPWMEDSTSKFATAHAIYNTLEPSMGTPWTQNSTQVLVNITYPEQTSPHAMTTIDPLTQSISSSKIPREQFSTFELHTARQSIQSSSTETLYMHQTERFEGSSPVIATPWTQSSISQSASIDTHGLSSSHSNAASLHLLQTTRFESSSTVIATPWTQSSISQSPSIDTHGLSSSHSNAASLHMLQTARFESSSPVIATPWIQSSIFQSVGIDTHGLSSSTSARKSLHIHQMEKSGSISPSIATPWIQSRIFQSESIDTIKLSSTPEYWTTSSLQQFNISMYSSVAPHAQSSNSNPILWIQPSTLEYLSESAYDQYSIHESSIAPTRRTSTNSESIGMSSHAYSGTFELLSHALSTQYGTSEYLTDYSNAQYSTLESSIAPTPRRLTPSESLVMTPHAQSWALDSLSSMLTTQYGTHEYPSMTSLDQISTRKPHSISVSPFHNLESATNPTRTQCRASASMSMRSSAHHITPAYITATPMIQSGFPDSVQSNANTLSGTESVITSMIQSSNSDLISITPHEYSSFIESLTTTTSTIESPSVQSSTAKILTVATETQVSISESLVVPNALSSTHGSSITISWTYSNTYEALVVTPHVHSSKSSISASMESRTPESHAVSSVWQSARASLRATTESATLSDEQTTHSTDTPGGRNSAADKEKDIPVEVIVPSVAGGLIVLVVIVALIIVIYRARQRRLKELLESGDSESPSQEDTYFTLPRPKLWGQNGYFRADKTWNTSRSYPNPYTFYNKEFQEKDFT